MKLLIPTLLFVFLGLTACQLKDDPCDEAPTYAKCSETPNTGTTCMAYWESWFYDESTGECEKKGYSGCEPVGFESKEECDKCDCYRLEGSAD